MFPGCPSICILTFYSAQVQAIQYELKSAGVGAASARVMTVDSFQGSEADIIFISFVRSNQHNRIGFLKDFQRLNVALTRAKYLLMVFGSAKSLENSGNCDLRNLSLNAKERNRYFSSTDVENMTN